ncbi:MAG: hypothetical protein CHACPFDD_00541 [Phycisphaerae bacterium]|nr:hypothetical protein [Phycisphaerae bacterium]
MNVRLSARTPPAALALLLAAVVAPARAATDIFQITSFADPPWSLTYETGFSGTVGTTAVWPAEMGWQGDQIDVAFDLPAGVPTNAVHYRFRMTINQRFSQSFDLVVSAGASLAELAEVHREFVDTARVFAATIPLDRFAAGQTNYIRIRGEGVLVGVGQPSGIQWNRWRLSRTDLPTGFTSADHLRTNQLERLTWYLQNAIQPSGLVRDSLPLYSGDAPFHPASPDAGGFALLGLCVADRFDLLPDAESRVESILSAYAGHTAGVTPTRNSKGHWWHWMNVSNGTPYPGWNDNYTTIGSALLVAGALFAKNHFIENVTIGSLADEMYATCDFETMIHPSLDGRVSLVADANGNALGWLPPWNEYMLIVSLALRQPVHPRATAVAPRWLDPANCPKISYRGNSTLTDNLSSFAPAFWAHQAHFFNADFSSNASFQVYFTRHQRADALYCALDMGLPYRHGLTAGVSPSGYTADSIYNHVNVYSPEAVAAWGDFDTTLEFAQDQPPTSNPRFRYGLTRVSVTNPTWIPFDAGLVDHTFLMFGLAESSDPLFFKQRQPFQTDLDADGIADAYDNCALYNPEQRDAADVNCDGSINGFDIDPLVELLTGGGTPCTPCAGDVNGDGSINGFDIEPFVERLTGA